MNDRSSTDEARRPTPPVADPIEAVHALELPPGSEGLLDRYEDELAGRKAIYVSTPITTGRRYLDWLGSESAKDSLTSVKSAVIAENIRAVESLVETVSESFPDRVVIDPTELDVSDWSQLDYHRFWTEVVERFASAVVFSDGWQLSTGCTIEFLAADRLGLQCLDSSLDPIPRDVARVMLDESSLEYRRVNHPNKLLESAARWLAANSLTSRGER